uniref:Uncharacterized protein n=1 Tax=Arundo donax TaxID=35708 RepID=A0A0A8XZ90_ARUDO
MIFPAPIFHIPIFFIWEWALPRFPV